MPLDISVGETLILKKGHPCGVNLWEVVRVGADFKLKCTGCGRLVMISRSELEKKVKKIEK